MADVELREYYDIVVVGAGPAGLNACLHAVKASASVSVLLVDKTTPWQHPIACAEAVGKIGLAGAIDVRQSWIRHHISKAAFHGPDGTTITYTDKNKGYIIDRARMQQDVAAECAQRGAHCVLGELVTAVSPCCDGSRTVSFKCGASVRARVVVDAGGPSSRLGKSEGLPWKALDCEPAYFAHVSGVKHDCDTVHLYVGETIAPGGYAWMFPGKEDTVNAGVLVGTSQRGAVNIRNLLNTFLKEQFPGSTVLRYHAGPIPCGLHRQPLALNGLIKTGDAASTVNPISRAGIVEALHSGGLAGDYAAKMLAAQTSRRALASLARQYEKAWFEKLGKRHQKLARVKSSLATVPDSDYIAAARSLSTVPQEKLTMALIFRKSLGRSPRLVWALRHLM